MTRRLFSNNGSKPVPELSDEDRVEMQTQIVREFDDLEAGQVENVVLVRAIANHWSADQLRAMAKRRGMNWRFVKPITDNILQVEGWALLSIMATVIGADMTYALLRKMDATVTRIEALEQALENAGKLSPRRAQMIDDSLDFLDTLSREGRQAYLRNIGRILNGS